MNAHGRTIPEEAPPGSGHSNRKASPEMLRRLSNNLKRLRRERGYTQKRLGKLCGFTKSYISNVERGTVNISLAGLEALTNALNCSFDDLLCPYVLSDIQIPVYLT